MGTSFPVKWPWKGRSATHDTEVRTRVLEEFHRIITLTAQAHGAESQIEFTDYVPVLVNDAALTAQMRPSLGSCGGPAKRDRAATHDGRRGFRPLPAKGPRRILLRGVRNPAVGAVHALHTPQMRIDEGCLAPGCADLDVPCRRLLDRRRQIAFAFAGRDRRRHSAAWLCVLAQDSHQLCQRRGGVLQSGMPDGNKELAAHAFLAGRWAPARSRRLVRLPIGRPPCR